MFYYNAAIPLWPFWVSATESATARLPDYSASMCMRAVKQGKDRMVLEIDSERRVLRKVCADADCGTRISNAAYASRLPCGAWGWLSAQHWLMISSSGRPTCEEINLDNWSSIASIASQSIAIRVGWKKKQKVCPKRSR
ncbi:hypothetical protein C8F01DRAFT_1169611 [Mycena amicta]|nr:hypothetical protein C8F01DRAFT_1169611 [Mycena amicta]